MEVGNFITTLRLVGLCLCFTFAIDASQNQDCACRGPTNYYKELGCSPVFRNPEDCCPIRYDCSALNNLANNQCLISGHIYNVNEGVRDEDGNACDWCTCIALSGEMASFTCAVPSCAMPHMPKESCRYVITNNCCGHQIVCPKEDGSFATCVVDGKTYNDGEVFVPSTEPEKRCRCAEGYTGENVEPYCVSPKHTWCNNVIHYQQKIRTCAPAYGLGVSLKTDCNEGFRCPTSTDVIIERTNQNGKSESEDPDMLCKFGNLTMNVGEKLNQDTSSCIQCVCEVPPILTCQQTITNEECNALKHS